MIGVLSAFYAGSVGAFAALKRRDLGVVIQGMAVGGAISIMAESYAIAHITPSLPPESVKFLLPWIQMALRVCCGMCVTKLFLNFEDTRDMMSTIVTGSVGSMQVFCSFGFEFTKSLEMSAVTSGEFGCTVLGCYLTLGTASLFALLGVVSQYNAWQIELKQNAQIFIPGTGYMPAIIDDFTGYRAPPSSHLVAPLGVGVNDPLGVRLQ